MRRINADGDVQRYSPIDTGSGFFDDGLSYGNYAINSQGTLAMVVRHSTEVASDEDPRMIQVLEEYICYQCAPDGEPVRLAASLDDDYCEWPDNTRLLLKDAEGGFIVCDTKTGEISAPQIRFPRITMFILGDNSALRRDHRFLAWQAYTPRGLFGSSGYGEDWNPITLSSPESGEERSSDWRCVVDCPKSLEIESGDV